jgi:3-oxoadipate enol-lactonase
MLAAGWNANTLLCYKEKMGKMDNNTVQLYFKEYGEGSPMVLVHGFPLDHTIWEPVVPLLKSHARLILPDLRGHGRSPAPDGVYDMRTIADDILALFDSLELERATLVGHSMGGYAALAFARAYPTRLSGLGFVSSHAAADNPEQRANRIKLARKVARVGVGFLAKDMAKKLTCIPELVEPLQDLMIKTPKEGVIGALKGMAERVDSTEFLNAIDVPTVVIAGTEDPIIPLERSETMVQLLGRAWLVEVPGAAHMPMMEAPEVVAAALRELLHAEAGYQPGEHNGLH